MYKLFLDDIRSLNYVHPNAPNDNWICAKTFDDAVKTIKEFGCPEYISFDHDLGIENEVEKTGYDFAKWIVEADMDGTIRIPPIFDFCVHSANPIGKNNIIGILDGYIDFKRKNGFIKVV